MVAPLAPARLPLACCCGRQPGRMVVLPSTPSPVSADRGADTLRSAMDVFWAQLHGDISVLSKCSSSRRCSSQVTAERIVQPIHFQWDSDRKMTVRLATLASTDDATRLGAGN